MIILILGCSPAPKQEDMTPVPASEINVDELLAEYKGGEWITDYQAAIKFAKETNKPILINFTGSDWCGWCIKLVNEVFSKAEFEAYAKENLILLKLDFPRSIPQSAELKQQNQSLQKKFGITGYPTIILIDQNEKEIGRSGYQQGGPVAYVNHLKQILLKK